jgi:hypothetical protein
MPGQVRQLACSRKLCAYQLPCRLTLPTLTSLLR